MSSARLEKWDERYRSGEQAFETPCPLVVEFTRDLTPGSALDLACGPGRNALYLAQRGWQVTAIDGSAVGIELLRARASQIQPALQHSIITRVADLEAGEFRLAAESYDLVLSCYYFQRSLIPRMKFALRPCGLLIAIAHIAEPDQPQGTPARAYPGELRTSFEGWKILHYREGRPAESCHRHAVAELVAQKPA